jgi:epoxyqueuosine reductase QueG
MNTSDLDAFLRPRGVAAFGVADVARYRREFPAAPLRMPAPPPLAVVLAWPLSAAVLETITDCPSPLYFHHYRQVNYRLDTLALEVAAFLQAAGFLALPLPASQTLDASDMSSHLSHRHMGYLAGLGWHGRNNLLVSPALGSRMRLVTVLTDAPLPPAEKPLADDCGTCSRCRKVCPARAIGETPADFRLDLCAARLTEFRKLPRIGQRICGVCVKACLGRGEPVPVAADRPVC